MQTTQTDLIIKLLNSLGSGNNTERIEAENRLKSFNNADGFLNTLLEVIQRGDVNFSSQLQAAIYFKNCVTKRWCLNCNEMDPDDNVTVLSTPICQQEKSVIRSSLLTLLVSVADSVSKQLIESLIQIGLEEYYATWPTMMKELISLCSDVNISILYRVLAVIEGICRVIETVPDNAIIGHVVIHFIDDLDEFLKTAWGILSQLLPTVSNDYNQCELVLNCLVYIVNIRKYWITVDVIKDINTDNEIENYSYIGLDLWMTNFIQLLDFTNPEMDETPTATVVEDLKSSIISFCSICVRNNADLFEPFFDGFTKAIWALLNSINKVGTMKYQDMIVSSLSFFSSLCTKRNYRNVFNSEEMMKQLLEFVIIPNCMSTLDISDQFETEPAMFIKNYEEGYKTSSQRYAVAHLIASLQLHFSAVFTPYLMQAISSLLNTSVEGRDCAYHLFLYRCNEFPCIMRPIRNIADKESVDQFITNIVIPDLSSTSPILLVDALVAVGVFLNQLSDEQLFTAINCCAQLHNHPLETVRVLAMIILERILSTIQINKRAIQPASLVSTIIPLTTNLLTFSLPIKQTDHYLIKAFLRIVLFLNEHILSYAKEMLEKLASILSVISQNLTNPHYIHYLFEALVAFVRISSSNQQLCGDIENYLLPSMQEYLNRNIIEFMPYILQLLGLILYSRDSISPFFMDLLPVICSETVWKERSNQTALVFLLKVYLLKNAEIFNNEQSLRNLLNIFRMLCVKKPSRVDGLELLFYILLLLPLQSYQPFLPTIMDILVAINAKGATHAVKEKTLLVLATLQILHGSPCYVPLLAQKSQLAFATFLRSLLMNGIEETQPILRKIEIYGVCQMLMDDIFNDETIGLIGFGLEMLVKTTKKEVSTMTFSTDFLETTVEYDAYHKLSLAKIQITDPLPQIQNVDAVAEETIRNVVTKYNSYMNAVLAALPEADRSYLEKHLC